jgi:hypothetical protein
MTDIKPGDVVRVKPERAKGFSARWASRFRSGKVSGVVFSIEECAFRAGHVNVRFRPARNISYDKLDWTLSVHPRELEVLVPASLIEAIRKERPTPEPVSPPQSPAKPDH